MTNTLLLRRSSRWLPSYRKTSRVFPSKQWYSPPCAACPVCIDLVCNPRCRFSDRGFSRSRIFYALRPSDRLDAEEERSRLQELTKGDDRSVCDTIFYLTDGRADTPTSFLVLSTHFTCRCLDFSRARIVPQPADERFEWMTPLLFIERSIMSLYITQQRTQVLIDFLLLACARGQSYVHRSPIFR